MGGLVAFGVVVDKIIFMVLPSVSEIRHVAIAVYDGVTVAETIASFCHTGKVDVSFATTITSGNNFGILTKESTEIERLSSDTLHAKITPYRVGEL